MKLEADFADLTENPSSARHALNCIITAYHLHEWVWGDWLENDEETRKALSVAKSRESFLAYIQHACPWFYDIRALANGTKHFHRRDSMKTEHVQGFGVGPYGVGPYGQSYLLIDHGEAATEHRFQTATALIEEVIRFWREFFDRY